ncbi:MAG TPA: hypothetical protein VF889_06555, partial [Bacteroidota bacterium]
MRPAFLALVVLTLAGTPSVHPSQAAQAPDADDQGAAFELRRKILLDTAAAQPETSFYTALARLMTGRDQARAFQMVDSLCRDRAIGGMFYSYTLIAAYLYARDLLPDSLKHKMREAFRLRTMYRGDTENHWVTYYTGIYLAAQTWPGEDGSRWFNGKSSEENFREAEGWLNHWIGITSTIGQGEFDSPTYITVFLAPLTVLQRFATDPAMKRKAQMTLDLILADFALEELDGLYGGGHSRDYPEDAANPISAPSTLWSWLYFGRPDVPPWMEARFRPRNRGSWEAVLAALSSYRVPAVVWQMARDRSVPYVDLETKRVRNIIRYADEMNPPVYKYSYVSAHYILGSLQGGILQPIQQHTWDVTFPSERGANTVFTLHPYVSGRELAMFFPEEPRFLTEEVDRYHLVYTSPEKWTSSSPCEQTFQHRNAIIVLYDIPPGTRFPHIDGFFPKTLDARLTDSTGWIFCRGGDTFIAFRPLQPWQWIEEPSDWRWRSAALKNGVVVEVGSTAEFPSFDAFMAAMRRTKLTSRVAAGGMEV